MAAATLQLGIVESGQNLIDDLSRQFFNNDLNLFWMTMKQFHHFAIDQGIQPSMEVKVSNVFINLFVSFYCRPTSR
jgi:hypothetical protein